MHTHVYVHILREDGGAFVCLFVPTNKMTKAKNVDDS